MSFGNGSSSFPSDSTREIPIEPVEQETLTHDHDAWAPEIVTAQRMAWAAREARKVLAEHGETPEQLVEDGRAATIDHDLLILHFLAKKAGPDRGKKIPAKAATAADEGPVGTPLVQAPAGYALPLETILEAAGAPAPHELRRCDHDHDEE